MDRILLTGQSGQVGGALLSWLNNYAKSASKPLEVVAPSRNELDLTDALSIRGWMRKVAPRWVVNPAAYTAVDKAETEPDLAYAINAESLRVLGEEAAALGTGVISFSTDYVFPGDGLRPWEETDATGPLGVYGASKLAGELALAATGAAHIVFRTSWVYGATGNNFLRTILRLARERDEMKIVADQHGAPTWSVDLARLVVHTINRIETQATAGAKPLTEILHQAGGTYHACGAGETSWYGFATEFVRLARLKEPKQHFAQLQPISSSEYPTPAKRPLNSRMNCERLARELEFVMPTWQESLAQVMAEL